MSELVTKKPCIDICEFKHAVCKACGRTQTEKKQWKLLAPQEKQAVWDRVLLSHGQGDSRNAKALRARYEKGLRKAREKELERTAGRSG